MARRDSRRTVFGIEFLEGRIALNAGSLTTVINVSQGTVARPNSVDRTTAEIRSSYIPPRKHASIFGLFVRPTASSSLLPKVVLAEGNQGRPLPLRRGRTARPGGHQLTVAFAKASRAGVLTTGVTGSGKTTGTYQIQTTLPGDLNGDGKVDFADLELFAPAYNTTLGEAEYNPAADFNRNGVVNLYDAKVMLHNMAPLTPKIPLDVRVHLAPGDQVPFSGTVNSGGVTAKRVVTVVGYTTPGSLVFEDTNVKRQNLVGTTQNYTWHGPAHVADANGFFSFQVTNKEGLNNNDFLIIDPYLQQKIIDLPIVWTLFASGKVD